TRKRPGIIPTIQKQIADLKEIVVGVEDGKGLFGEVRKIEKDLYGDDKNPGIKADIYGNGKNIKGIKKELAETTNVAKSAEEKANKAGADARFAFWLSIAALIIALLAGLAWC